MKEFFTSKKFRKASLETIANAIIIIEQYQEIDLRLTLRQLYYQFVARDLLPNTMRSYKNLSLIHIPSPRDS